MKTTSRTKSRPRHIVCPACGSGELRPRGSELAGCDSCGISVESAFFRTLEQIATLPDALGRHPCECGHPEMRRLPDEVFHCPACGSEVLPIKITLDPKKNAPRIGFHEGEAGPREGYTRAASRAGGTSLGRHPPWLS